MTTTALPALGTRVRVDRQLTGDARNRARGTVVGHGTTNTHGTTEPAVLVHLDANHAGWIEPNGRPGTRGSYVSTLVTHPDNLTAEHGPTD